MAMSDALEAVEPRWDVPRRVRALTTLRGGGVSTGPYASLNLGDHAGDDPGHVAENRRRLREAFGVPGKPVWLTQVHGTRCLDLADAHENEAADGSHTVTPGLVCAVLTADCLPLFVSDGEGRRVGLFHVGWKGLAAGIVEQALSIFTPGAGTRCWLGPAIGPDAFEIGPEVREALEAPGNESCFRRSTRGGRWLADLYGLVAHRLHRGGVDDVDWDPAACTYNDPDRFFSYRREHHCGRMASLIWIEALAGERSQE